MVFPKTELLTSFKKFFSKSFFDFFLSSVFKSIYGFSQSFWLNLMTLWIFFKTNSWFNACFKFIMSIKYSSLSYKFATIFLAFLIFVLTDKNDKSLWRLNKFSGYWTLTPRKYPSSLSSLWFFIKLSSNSEMSPTHYKLLTGNFWDIAYAWKLFTSKYLRYEDSLFLSISCTCY